MSPLADYLRDLRDISSTGATVAETTYYGRLETLLNTVGATLKPKVRCILHPGTRGAGLPDGGLFYVRAVSGEQKPMRNGKPKYKMGRFPARGVFRGQGMERRR